MAHTPTSWHRVADFEKEDQESGSDTESSSSESKTSGTNDSAEEHALTQLWDRVLGGDLECRIAAGAAKDGWKEHYVDLHHLNEFSRVVVPLLAAGSAQSEVFGHNALLCSKLLGQESGGDDAEFLGNIGDDEVDLVDCAALGRAFVTRVEQEAEHVNAFYLEILKSVRSAELPTSLGGLNHIARAHTLGSKRDKARYKELREGHSSAIRARDQYTEEFKTMERLHAFCVVNRAAFCQVVSGKSLHVFQSLKVQLESYQFWETEGLPELRSQIIDSFASLACAGNRPLAEAQLMHDAESRERIQATGLARRTGVLCGMAVGMYGMLLFFLYNMQPYSIKDPLPARTGTAPPSTFDLYLPIYKGIGEFILWCLCWSLLLYIWRAYGLAFHSLFNFRPERTLKWQEVLQCGAVMVTMFCISLSLFVHECSQVSKGNRSAKVIGMAPLVLYVACFTYFLVWSRGRLFRLIVAAVVSPFVVGGVSAVDSFVGDVMTSMVKPTKDVIYGCCFFLSGDFLKENRSDMTFCYDAWFSKGVYGFALPFVVIFPTVLRICQNLRLLWSTKKQHPHLTNTSKYVFSLLVSVMSLINHQLSSGLAPIWYVLLIGSSVYSFVWDITMDWSLFAASRYCLCLPCGKFKLRYRRLWAARWVYGMVFVLDLFGRFFFTYTLIPIGQDVLFMGGSIYMHDLLWWLNLVAPVIEVLRRTMWSVLKVETMQLAAMDSHHGVFGHPSTRPAGRPLDHGVVAAFSQNAKMSAEICCYLFAVMALIAVAIATRDGW